MTHGGVCAKRLSASRPAPWREDPSARAAARHRPRHAEGGVVLLGPGTFDAATGELRLLDGFAPAGPGLDVWRPPTDNDLGAP